jgi:TetR/AcrR family transcriptional regulator, repressor of fatR-cypB operon
MPTADLTRQRLVRAALELFTTQGYGDTTTAQIARKAGVAEGTIYRHFQSKQHLLNELYRGAARWAVKFVREADVAPAEPREKLRLLADALVRGAAREPAAARIFFLERHAGLLDPSSREAAEEFRVGLEALIAQGKAAATVRPGAVDVWAAVWLAVVGLAIERVCAGEWKADQQAVELVAAAAWEAIAVGQADSRTVGS